MATPSRDSISRDNPARENELDTLSTLEERVTRAVEVVARLRSEKDAVQKQFEAAMAERDVARKETADAHLHIQKLTQELDELHGERKQVRTRIEKLLGQMDLLGAT